MIKSNLHNYFKSISRVWEVSKYTRKQLRELIKKAQKGDKKARNIVIESNLQLVVFVAKRITNPCLELEDRIAYGNLGLFKAIKRFDHSKKTKFTTYAYFWIMQAIRRAIDNRGDMIRKPVWLKNEIRRYFQVVSKYPRIGESQIAKKMKISVKRVKEIISYIDVVHSLNIPCGEDGSSEIGDFLVSRGENKIEDLDEYLRLTPREKDVIELRYGLKGETKTLDEISKKYNISRQRVSQIQEEVLLKLKKKKWAKELRRGGER